MKITLTDGAIETRSIYEFKHSIGDFGSFELLQNESELDAPCYGCEYAAVTLVREVTQVGQYGRIIPAAGSVHFRWIRGAEMLTMRLPAVPRLGRAI